MPYDSNGDWYYDDEDEFQSSGAPTSSDYTSESETDTTGVPGGVTAPKADSNSSLLDTLKKTITDPNVLALVTAELQKKTSGDLASSLKEQAVDRLAAFADQIRAANVPDLSSYVSRVQRAVSQGTIDPGQAMTFIAEQSKLNGIEVPKEFTDTQADVLSRLGEVADKGYTDIERAAIQKAINQTATQTRGEEGALRDEFQQRGQYGAGNELVQRAIVQQGGANRNAQSGLDIEAAGLTRALGALKDQGSMATALNDQSFNQQSQVASAQDTINKLNAQLKDTTALANAKNAQVASAGDITNKLDVQKTNMTQDANDQQRLIDAAKAEEDLKRQREQTAVVAQSSAGTNAAKMYDSAYGSKQSAQGAANTAATNAASSGSDVGKYAGYAKTAYDIWKAFSDPTLKEDKKPIKDDLISRLFQELVPSTFKYTKEGQSMGAPKGKVVGIMATDLEKTPQGADLVIDVNGKKAIDGQKAMSLVLAALASHDKKLTDLEGK